VELAIEGIHEGKYTKAVLEWGTNAFDLFPGLQNDLTVIFCTNNTGIGQTRFLAKVGTVTQVKFWMVNYLDHGFLWPEIDLYKGVQAGYYGTGISNILSVHRSIYRHIFFWLEIDLYKGVLTGYYGTGIGGEEWKRILAMWWIRP
jgi:hypothetical protein